MCSTCGCGEGNLHIDGVSPHEHPHTHQHDHEHEHDGCHHTHPHEHMHSHSHHHEHTRDSAHIDPAPRMVEVERDLLERNDAVARENRQWFRDHALFALNLVSSPGAGKTTLLVHTIEALKNECQCVVIEGDQQTQNDAERIRATGIPAVQINTGKGCHLDARMVQQAMNNLPPLNQGLLFIENVGNLVCPAAFDLGEAHKVVVLSVTEGTDKPQKYPDMFHEANIMLINKIDLLPYVDFDVEQAIAYAQQVNPNIKVIRISAVIGDGMDEWLNWLKENANEARKVRDDDVHALRRRIAELEARLNP
ncbi:MAG: hydrogenase nickel incorporation protein HypB [Burkholderiales bacterium]|jgi:hydrogenase nickel incorporation protein HypB|nr:hydrogenase nickel incorporation protein HypB [Burkholderiales bacterium]